MTQDIRWKQRFQHFKKSYEVLERALAIDTPSETEQAGVIQLFEVCFELGWKLQKDYLEGQGFFPKTPRDTIKQFFQIELISDGEGWLKALEDRDLTSHIYDEEVVKQVDQDIRRTYFPLLRDLHQVFQKFV